MLRTLIIPFFLGIAIASFGQTAVLEKYVQMGISNNLQLQKNTLAIDKQQYKIAEAQSNRLPVVTFEPSYLLAAGGRRLNFPIGDLFNPAYQALNDLSQTNNFPTNLENVDEQLTPSNFHDTRFYASYPIFNPAIYYNIKAQEQLITVEQAKIEAYKIELIKNIKTAYYNYLKTFEVLQIFESSENLLNQLYQFNQKLVKYDKATPDILAGVHFEKEKINSERASLLQQQEMAKAYFNSLLNRPFSEDIDRTDVLSNTENIAQNLPDLRQKAVTNRPELEQINNARRATQLVTQIEEKSLLPTVGIQAAAGFQGFGYSFDSEQLLGTLALGAKWTIYDGKKRQQKIEQSKIETMELQKDYELVQQQIELQVIGAYHALNAAQQQVVAEQAAVDSARERFNLIKKRYENDQAILIEYLDAQTKLTNAQISLSVSQYDVLIRRAELERAVAY
ncbi:MAG: TolC family protein [Bacteroidota bacterium]